MQHIPFADYSLSRLMLGTVQFGLDYGIANQAGRPPYETARDILACALAGGVNGLDTAAAYGESESVLGRALAELDAADRTTVITKVTHFDPTVATAEAERIIRDSVACSLQRLRLNALPVCLLHSEKYMRHLGVLRRLKAEGLIRHIGVSVGHDPRPPLEMIAAGAVDALQVPANVLDPRHRLAGVFEAARKKGVAVFVRSVYLQGLLLMPEAAVPPVLAEVIPTRRRLAALAQAAGMTLAELAVRYMLGVDGVTCALTGVETVAQMRENIALFENGGLDPALMHAAEEAAGELPERILSPILWPKKTGV